MLQPLEQGHPVVLTALQARVVWLQRHKLTVMEVDLPQQGEASSRRSSTLPVSSRSHPRYGGRMLLIAFVYTTQHLVLECKYIKLQ